MHRPTWLVLTEHRAVSKEAFGGCSDAYLYDVVSRLVDELHSVTQVFIQKACEDLPVCVLMCLSGKYVVLEYETLEEKYF